MPQETYQLEEDQPLDEYIFEIGGIEVGRAILKSHGDYEVYMLVSHKVPRVHFCGRFPTLDDAKAFANTKIALMGPPPAFD